MINEFQRVLRAGIINKEAYDKYFKQPTEDDNEVEMDYSDFISMFKFFLFKKNNSGCWDNLISAAKNIVGNESVLVFNKYLDTYGDADMGYGVVVLNNESKKVFEFIPKKTRKFFDEFEAFDYILVRQYSYTNEIKLNEIDRVFVSKIINSFKPDVISDMSVADAIAIMTNTDSIDAKNNESLSLTGLSNSKELMEELYGRIIKAPDGSLPTVAESGIGIVYGYRSDVQFNPPAPIQIADNPITEAPCGCGHDHHHTPVTQQGNPNQVFTPIMMDIPDNRY